MRLEKLTAYSASLTYALGHAQAAECIAKGQEKYNAGDRMGALKFFEQSLKKVTIFRSLHTHMRRLGCPTGYTCWSVNAPVAAQ